MLKHRKCEGIQKSRLAVILLGVVLAVGIAVLLMGIGSHGGGYSVYLKNGELFYTDGTADHIQRLTSDLFQNFDRDRADQIEVAADLSDFVVVRDDRVFYPDRLDDESSGISLYCRDLTRPEKAPVKVGSDVTQYAVHEYGSQVLYLENGVLYCSSLNDRERIGSHVVMFEYTENFQKVLFWDERGNCYRYSAGKTPVCIAQDITDVDYTAADLSWFCYRKDGELYVQKEDEEYGTRIAENVSDVQKVYETGEIYYLTEKADTEVKTLMDFVVDDLAEADTQAEDSAEKQRRDELRLELSQIPVDGNAEALWFYDGQGQTARIHGVSSWNITFSETAPIAVFEAYYEGEEPETILFSELCDDEYFDILSAENDIRHNTDADMHNYYCTGTEMHEIDAEQIMGVTFSPDNSEFYFVENWNSLMIGVQDLTDNSRGAHICEGEIRENFYTGDGKFCQAVTDYNGDGYVMCLYAGNEFISNNVYFYEYNEKNDRILYVTDWNEDRGYGTLNMYSKGKNTVIAYDMRWYTVAENGDIFYLQDYSMERYRGTLCRYNGGSPVKIDEDVMMFLLLSADRKFME